METSPIPITLFTYNRPDHTQSALSALANCGRLEDCHLVIYCDGPKTSAHEAGVEATRRVIKDWAPRYNADVIERSENLGLARSIVSGVTEQCQKCGRVIVLEDDLVVSPDFLDYMLQALERYKDNSNIYQVSGYMFPIDHPTNPDAFFLPLTTTWGWATWERAWRVFDWDANGALLQLANLAVRRRFNLENSYPYYEILKNRLTARNDSWGILWWYSVFNKNGLVMHPRRSLVWNGGFDNSGIHSGAPLDTMQSHREDYDRTRLSYPLVFPKEVTVDQVAFSKLKSYLRSRSSWKGKARGILHLLFKGILKSL